MDNEISKDLQKKIKNEYFRNWRKQNPEKVRKINERFWRKQLENQNQIDNLKKGAD